MSNRYPSRLASVEEKKNIKKAIWLVVITVVAAFLFIFYGISALGKLTGFVSDVAKGDKPIDKMDNTPPAPPSIEQTAEYTNQSGLTITGQSEIGAIIKLKVNGRDSEIAVDDNGKFSKEISLIDGENKISAIAVDAAGNESLKTDEHLVIFDNKKPEVTIDQPSEGQTFYGSKQKQIQIIGKTEEGVSLYINSRFVSVNSDGSFKFSVTLGDGENKFNIKATDLAGNMTEMDLIVNFTP